MALFCATIFLSAFLLFQVQPLIGKVILPWFGGSPAVWLTCMLFFQVALFGGYLYAHLLASRLAPRRQVLVHAGLAVLTLLALPVTPSEAWKPAGGEDPTLRILLLLASTVGAPFALLSSTGPLLQSWFGRAFPGRSPYRLYALSNAGSLLALVSYPFAVEPFLRLRAQADVWSAGHVLFIAALVACGALVLRRARATGVPVPAARAAGDEAQAPPAGLDVVLWLALSASASVMLLATTNQICLNVAVVPFLWIVPLALYLLSFILCFDGERWYSREVFSWAMVVALGAGSFAWALGPELDLRLQLGLLCFALFASCMTAHGELVHCKPASRYLTRFYLCVSAGGALGGVLVTLVAPQVFDAFWEFPFGLAAVCVLLLVARRRDALTRRLQRVPAAWSVGALLCFGLASCYGAVEVSTTALETLLARRDVLVMTRSFWGTLYVAQSDVDDPERALRSLGHGNTVHGTQFQAPEKRAWPTTYYSKDAGVGVALAALLADGAPPRSIGVVGLGTGTLATWARPEDRLTFFEIDPSVVALARRWFTYLEDAEARGVELDVRIGDARIVLEQDLLAGARADLDLLVVDAFSSDAIPVHLLTRECLALYLEHVRPDGVIAFHVSNRLLDLPPLVRSLARERGAAATLFRSSADLERGTAPSEWVLVARDEATLAPFDGAPARSAWGAEAPAAWSDDFSSLLGLLR